MHWLVDKSQVPESHSPVMSGHPRHVPASQMPFTNIHWLYMPSGNNGSSSSSSSSSACVGLGLGVGGPEQAPHLMV